MRTSGPLLLAYHVHAPHHTRTVALLHSLALDRTVWRPLISMLSERRAVVSIDLRGHGASPSASDFTIEEMADDVALTLSWLDRKSVAVIGMSMGGCVAQAFAVRHPDRVEALALLDTTAWYGPDAPSAWEERAKKAQDGGMTSLSRFQLERWFSDDFRVHNEVLCDDLLRVFAANNLESYVASCRALGAVNLREEIRSIRTPTVVVVGEDDVATPPSHAADIQARISGSVMHILPGARHLTAVEAPLEVLHHISPFLD